MAKKIDHKNPAWERMEKGQDTRIARFLGIPGQERGLGQCACLFLVCVCTNPDSCFHCCPWFASWLCFHCRHIFCVFFVPRTDRSHLWVDITSFHAVVPNLPMHSWRMDSVLQSLQDFCFGIYVAMALGALASLGSLEFPPTYSITAISLGDCFSSADHWACLMLILSEKKVQNLPVGRRDLISPIPKSRVTKMSVAWCHQHHLADGISKESLCGLLFLKLKWWVPSSDQSRLEALPFHKEKSHSCSSCWVTGE